MTQRGWDTDECPAFYEHIKAADILVLGGPKWLGDPGSVTVIEWLYGCSGILI